MLPGVSTRGEPLNEPMPPTIVPNTGPPFASAPWQAAHFCAYTCWPCFTEPRPAGSPSPSGVRTSMFQAATSASVIGLPKRGLSASGCTGCGPELPIQMPVEDFAGALLPPPRFAHAITARAPATAANPALSLADDIAHLPIGVDGPRLDAVVVLHEAHDRALLCDLLHARLHVPRAVDRAAHQQRGLAIPIPRRLEAREALVHDRLLELRLAPVLAAVDRNVDRANLAGAGPCESGDLVEAR